MVIAVKATTTINASTCYINALNTQQSGRPLWPIIHSYIETIKPKQPANQTIRIQSDEMRNLKQNKKKSEKEKEILLSKEYLVMVIDIVVPFGCQ